VLKIIITAEKNERDDRCNSFLCVKATLSTQGEQVHAVAREPSATRRLTVFLYTTTPSSNFLAVHDLEITGIKEWLGRPGELRDYEK
jgi:hypothetical protein